MNSQVTIEKYRTFWENRTSPLSRCDTPEFRRLVAQELSLLLGGCEPLRVLEIGCGNGALFDYFGFPPEFYRGVDFSPSMLEVFRREHPEVDLVKTEGSSYVDANSYDLILAHDVISHFSPAMLARHCANARTMMHSESLLIWSCVPWRSLRASYDLGIWSNGGSASIARWGKNRVRRLLGREVIGNWYSTGEITRIAKHNSLRVRFHGSISHPYRFHAVLSAL
jgi:SAM-dependent methyltransferase